MNKVKKVTQRFYKENCYFTLGPAYRFGVEMALSMNFMFERKLLTGRACNSPHDYGLLAQTIFHAGRGNHLEIGTLWGASTIIAGLTKKEFGLWGNVFCVDPLNGLYGEGKTDKHAGRRLPSKKILEENLKTMNLKAVIIPKKSFPFPEEINKTKFSSTYIDGDHWGQGPQRDLDNAVKRTTKYIIIDNYDKTHPAIVKAVRGAKWRLVYLESIMAILQNPNL